MDNPFKYTDNNKRYHTLSYYNNITFGGRVQKASLDLGCTCPNIDGSVGTGGCTYCDTSAPSLEPLDTGLTHEISRIRTKHPTAGIIAYFQRGTNTYCSPSYLYDKCRQVLSYKEIQGISIGTRADCIDTAMADMLFRLADETTLTVELGLQTIHDCTAKRINRCHTYEQFLKGYALLKDRGIRICVHLINSLPWETQAMMIQSARTVGALNPEGIKIHMLNILEGTAMAEEYNTSPFPLLSREEYVDTVVRQLEFIPAATVIERLTGDGIQSRIIAPLWARDKLKTLAAIDKRQAAEGSYQGKAL